jgi:hypothetical protein
MNPRHFAAACLALLLTFPAWAANLVYLDTPMGAERLMAAQNRQQFFLVAPYLDTQQNLAFCGPASMAAVLNSLGIPRPYAATLHPYRYFTQDNLFTPATQRIKSYALVSAQGMTLAEFTEFLNALGVRAVSHYADGLEIEALRTLVRSALENPARRLVVNYSRKPLGQVGDGHLSPVAAYDEASDSVLVLDVAKFKYPPTWVPLGELLQAMRTTDPDSGKSRGMVLIGP